MPDQQPAQPIYNNKRFKVSDYNFEMFIGPRAGDQVKDYTLTDLKTGEDVKLTDFNGKWVVIETGSSTCSMYTKNIIIRDNFRKWNHEYQRDSVVIFINCKRSC